MTLDLRTAKALRLDVPATVLARGHWLVDRTYGQDYSHHGCWLMPVHSRAEAAMPVSPMIEITYCRLCGWGLRAGWMAQEMLTTFAEELGSVTLTPDRTGGVFEVRIDDEVIWSRKERGRFPEIKEIKQLVRDRVVPGRPVGHTVTPNHIR
jgi:selenoprotein W-related protein